MKLKPLPNIKRDEPTTVYVAIASFLITFSIAFLCWFAYKLPVTTAFVPVPIVAVEKTKADVVLDATTDIIMRDGKIPERVARKYTLWIFEASQKHGVDPITILSVMSVESTFKQDAVSGANAIGLMQVIARWHPEKTTQVGLFDPKNNINVGTKILKEYRRLSRSDSEMFARYNGTWKKSVKYSSKVLAKRAKYQHEIMKAVREA
jgi:soluble lytic murein transglycosylase-like protein